MGSITTQDRIHRLTILCAMYIGQLEGNPTLLEDIWSVWSNLRTLLEQKKPSAQPSEIKETFKNLKDLLNFTSLSNSRRLAFFSLEQAIASRCNISLKARDVKILGTKNQESLSPASTQTPWNVQAWQMRAHF